jgi:hypothetical protein
MKAYIQPFEKQLALEELKAVAGANPVPVSQIADDPLLFQVKTSVPADRVARQLAYWEVVMADRPYLTTQVLREATVNVVRNGVLPREIPALLMARTESALPNRRCLRYASHGLHEYRGKFFPQLVRSLLNVSRIPVGGVVADPMCGSGTTAVEAILGGYRTIGLDRNPLSVMMTRAKCSAIALDPDELVSTYNAVREHLLAIPPRKQSSKLPYFERLPEDDKKYLRAWFSEQVLADLDQIAITIGDVEEEPLRDLLRLVLSNILRKVSWQKDDDLRVRKELRLDAEIDPIREFLEEMGRSVRLLLAFLFQFRGKKLGRFDVREGDARQLQAEWTEWAGKVDVVVTSPPYATALPYLDTDRLSLCYLNLLSRPQHRKYDQLMIGNREITEKQRLAHWSAYQHDRQSLPDSICCLIDNVEKLNSRSRVGFRRRNLSALLARYFVDMKHVLGGIGQMLKPGAPAYVVVGNNHTIAGGKHIDIETASLLADLGSSEGFAVETRIPMEMLVSRDIFRKNAVASEEILCFRKSAKSSRIV